MLRFSPNPNRAHLIPWREWSAEAFRAARQQDKPLMLFLSAFWCRYCQRMDEEAFSETENIALLNAYFISLRVENAQRPDIDARYNLNGWPTIGFMTPQGQLLAAVNYLPTEQFKNVLIDIYIGYQQCKGDLSSLGKTDDGPSDPASRHIADELLAANLVAITDTIMGLADRVNGGYGSGQKFLQAEASDFLLSRYEATKDPAYLNHVCLTFDRMRRGEIYDHEAGGYFRTSSGADWSQPHREKLLSEQAGLLSNCLKVFRLTQGADYAHMAGEIVGYLDNKLFNSTTGAFFGCEDFLRREAAGESSGGEFFTIIDECVYTDANALTIEAYLATATILGKPGCKEQALTALEFLLKNCWNQDGGMCHFFDGEARVPGLLLDQASFGVALLHAHQASGDRKYLDRAKELAAFIQRKLNSPAGGFFDICDQDLTGMSSRLTLIESNGAAASFFLQLAEASGDKGYRDAARWALSAFTEDFRSHGIHASRFGQALGEWLSRR